MTEPRMLTEAQIERLTAALRIGGAPVVDRLAQGLTDDEMDEIVAPLHISLPVEARTWWGCHNGSLPVDGDGSQSTSLSAAWWWAPLEEAAEHCRLVRELDDDPDKFWLASWLPIVVGDGELAIETAVGPGAPSPVHLVDFEGDELHGHDHVPVLPSLGALVAVWTTALVGGATWYDPELGCFTIDWHRFDELGLPNGLL